MISGGDELPLPSQIPPLHITPHWPQIPFSVTCLALHEFESAFSWLKAAHCFAEGEREAQRGLVPGPGLLRAWRREIGAPLSPPTLISGAARMIGRKNIFPPHKGSLPDVDASGGLALRNLNAQVPGSAAPSRSLQWK